MLAYNCCVVGCGMCCRYGCAQSLQQPVFAAPQLVLHGLGRAASLVQCKPPLDGAATKDAPDAPLNATVVYLVRLREYDCVCLSLALRLCDSPFCRGVLHRRRSTAVHCRQVASASSQTGAPPPRHIEITLLHMLRKSDLEHVRSFFERHFDGRHVRFMEPLTNESPCTVPELLRSGFVPGLDWSGDLQANLYDMLQGKETTQATAEDGLREAQEQGKQQAAALREAKRMFNQHYDDEDESIVPVQGSVRGAGFSSAL